jgi:hypothetical protein
MADFPIRISAQSVNAVAVARRRGCPARQPSPKQAWASRIAITASLLDVEHRVGHIALREDRALPAVGRECSAGADVGEARVGIARVLGCHTHPLA